MKQTVLACCGFVFLALPLAATIDDFTYVTNGTTITITDYKGTNNVVTIPDTINDLHVTRIGARAFWLDSRPTSIMIPNSVVTIDKEAFANCPGLTNMIIPDSVTSIGENPFGCDGNLTHITIGSSITNIDSCGAIYCANLKGVYFKGNAPAIGPNMFFCSSNVTVYYLPDTTGWGPTIDGRPTMLWNPLIQLSTPSFGMEPNHFGFNINGTTNIPIVVQACTNLENAIWVPLLTTNLTDGLVRFNDPAWTNHPARFYNIRWP